MREEKTLNPDDYPSLQFPDEDWEWFLNAAKKLEINIDLNKSKAQFENIYSFLSGVNEWMNLTRVKSARDYLKQHILDSLSILTTDLLKYGGDDVFLDLGSGGGYPTLPLIITNPEIEWVLVDSRKKKVDFLNASLKLINAEFSIAQNFRAREVAHSVPLLRKACRLITTRAAGNAAKLLEECSDLLMQKGRIVMYKGPSYMEAEHQDAIKAAVKFKYKFIESISIKLEDEDPERLFVVFEKK